MPHIWQKPRLRHFKAMNNDLVSKRGIRMLAVTYYGKRHLTTATRR